MTKIANVLLSVCKLVVFLALLAVHVLPRETLPYVATVLNEGAFLLSVAAVYKLHRSGALRWKNTTAESVASADVDYVAGLLVMATILTRAFEL